MAERRKQYDSGEHILDGRYSNKHVFSTLIKCEHCGRSFTRKYYKHKNSRVYWKCTTNDQFTAQRCDNTVKINENDLLAAVSDFLKNAIDDKEKFIQDIIGEVSKNLQNSDIEIDIDEIKKKKKLIEAKRDKYQEMYICDVMTMTELKQKTSILDKEKERLDDILAQKSYADKADKSIQAETQKYVNEIENFLSLKNVTNMDMRKIISHITVNKSGEVKIHLKDFAIAT